MSPVPQEMRRIALRILAREIESSNAAGQATFQAIDELRPQLVNLMGIGGFRGLVSRAISLASDEVRWLRAVHVKSDGSLEGFEEYAQVAPAQFAQAKVAVLAQLLVMLIALIGARLTLRLMLDIWPKLSLGDLNLGNGEAHEKEK